jgi:hypothetical protein
MRHDLVGYILEALDETEHATVTQLLETSAEATRQIELLRRSFRPLEAGLHDCDLPCDLAARTCERIRAESED